jgi:hypothetical protein
VQPEAGHIHVGHVAGRVQPYENIAELIDVFRVNAARVVVFVEAFQPFMAYRRDHPEP